MLESVNQSICEAYVDFELVQYQVVLKCDT